MARCTLALMSTLFASAFDLDDIMFWGFTHWGDRLQVRNWSLSLAFPSNEDWRTRLRASISQYKYVISLPPTVDESNFLNIWKCLWKHYRNIYTRTHMYRNIQIHIHMCMHFLYQVSLFEAFLFLEIWLEFL